jgi:hypothetical protein
VVLLKSRSAALQGPFVGRIEATVSQDRQGQEVQQFPALFDPEDFNLKKNSSYGQDGPGIEFRWRRDFSCTPKPATMLTEPPVHWTQGLSLE